MRMGFLGVLQVEGGVALRPRTRTVLAALAVQRGEFVSPDRLAEAVWAGEPPKSWPKQVQHCVWDLRKVLGADVIQTVDGQYRLAGDADLDITEFESLVDRGRVFVATGEPDRAASTFARALDLWRGRPFEELDGWMAGRHEAARLEEVRRCAEEDLIEARLAAGHHRDVVGLAGRRAAEEPLRERRWALLALAHYRCGNQADALRALRRARRTLLEELGIAPGADLVALETAILGQDAALEGPAAHLVTGRCPYKGLAAYDAEDAEVFFGRDGEIAAALERLDSVRLLAVAGPSGSGKSSLMRAGIVPALRRRGRAVVVVTPGADPDAALAHALATTESDPIVVVDQLEEVFAGHHDPQGPRVFCARLAAYAIDRAHVIVTIRSDHLGNLAAEPTIARLVEQGLHLVGPMTGNSLRATIEGPAAAAGLRLESGLVDLLVRETEGEPAALPLLSHALAETWERRDGRVLTVEGYRATGEIRGAVARSAEQLYASLPPDQQAKLKSVVLRLVVPTADGEPIRAHLPRHRLSADVERQRVLDLLASARLVTSDEHSVELAHESVVRAWPRLRGWLEEDAVGQRLIHHLATAAEDWDTIGRPDSELYRGARLEAALEWRETTSPELTIVESAFLDASAAAAESERRSLLEQTQRQARQNRRLRWALVGLASLLIVAAVSGTLFVRQRDRAERASHEATVRRLASEAVAAIDEDPELAMLLGLEAIEISERAGQTPPPQAVSALQAATQSSRLVFRRPEAYSYLDAGSDGTRIATASASNEGAALVWDAETGDELVTLRGPTPGAVLQDVQFSPDGALIGAAYSKDVEGIAPAVVLWDATSGDEVARLRGDGSFYSLAFSPDGLSVASLGEDEHGRVTIWDVKTGSELLTFELEDLGNAVAFLPDSTSIAVTEWRLQRVGIYSADDGTRLRTIRTPGYRPEVMALHAGSGLLALSSQSSREVRIVELATGKLFRRIPATDGGAVSWSPDGARLAIGGLNGSAIRIVDVDTMENTIVLRGHQSGSWDVEFIDADHLASVGQVSELRVWDVSADGPSVLHAIAPRSGSTWSVSFSPDGSELIVETGGQTIERLDAETGERLQAREDQLVGRLPYFAPVSADWRFVASSDEADGTSAVLDVASLEPVTPLPACTRPVGISSDGALVVLDGRALCAEDIYEAPPEAELRSRIVERISGREVLDLGERRLWGTVFNPAGLFAADRFLAVNDDLFNLEIYDVAEGRLIGRLPVDDYLFLLRFDPTGRWLVGSTGAGRAWVIDMAAVAEGTAIEDAVVLDLVAHNGGITGLDISAGGTLATVALEEQVRLWNLHTGELLTEFRTAPPAGIATLEFSPDGSYLLYTDGAVLRRYLVETDELTNLAHQLLTRELSDQECETYAIDCD